MTVQSISQPHCRLHAAVGCALALTRAAESAWPALGLPAPLASAPQARMGSLPAIPGWWATLRQLVASGDLDAFAEATSERVALNMSIHGMVDAAVDQRLGCELDAVSEAIAARVATRVRGVVSSVEQRLERELHAVKGELDAVKLRMNGMEQRYEQRCRQGGGQQQATAALGLAAALQACVGGEGFRTGGSQAAAAASAGAPLSAGAGAGRAKKPRRPTTFFTFGGLPTLASMGSYAEFWRLWKHGRQGHRPLQETNDWAMGAKVVLQPVMFWCRVRSVMSKLTRRAAAETEQQGRPVGEAEVADMLDEAIRQPDGTLLVFCSSVNTLHAARNKRRKTDS